MDNDTEGTEQSSDEQAGAPDEASATETVEAKPEEAQLGEAGKRALDRMKQERNEARRELEKLRREAMSDQERAVAEARDSGRADALRELSGRLVDAEIRSAAVTVRSMWTLCWPMWTGRSSSPRTAMSTATR